MNAVLKLLQKNNSVSKVLVVLTIAALILGFVGNVQKNFSLDTKQERTLGVSAKLILDSIPPSVGVFKPKISGIAGSANWPLTFGRALGSLVSLAAVLTVLLTILKEHVERFRISLMRNHIIVFGFDGAARQFLKSKSRPSDKSIVVIDPTSQSKIKEKVHAAGGQYFAASLNAKLGKTLSACRLQRADTLIISTGDDEENLTVTQAIADDHLLSATRETEVMLPISNGQLLKRLERSDDFMQSLGDKVSMRLFNAAQCISVQLLSQANFAQHAIDLEQDRIRVIIVGQDQVAIEIVTQFLRQSSIVGFGKPIIDWVVEDGERFQKRLGRSQPALAALARGQSTTDHGTAALPLAWAVELNVHEVEPTEDTSSPGVLTAIAAHCDTRPAALILTGDNDVDFLLASLVLKEMSIEQPLLCCPIYVQSDVKSSLDFFARRNPLTEEKIPRHLKNIQAAESLQGVVEPFGRQQQVYAWVDADDVREINAKKLHAAYCQKRLAEEGGDHGFDRDSSTRPWSLLAETYKNANRRAADQLSSVRMSLERISRSGDFAFNGPGDPINEAVVEALAEQEHNSWWIDRELDGWRYAETRNNDLKRHPDLIPYSDLTDATKDYDRNQILVLASYLGYRKASDVAS